jgi:hypothetical protein
MHRSDRTIRTQPFRAVLRERTLSLLWLARRIGFSHAHTRAVACGYEPSSARFRAQVAAALDLPVRDLFFDDHPNDSSASAPETDGSDDGAGIAVGATRYHAKEAPVVSTLA